MKNFIIVIYILLYFVGCSVLSNDVRKSCTHGNCKHGFYSKYNKDEKNIYYLWEYGGFIIGILLLSFSNENNKDVKKVVRYDANEINRQKHKESLKKRLIFPSGMVSFTNEEIAVLEKYGGWLEDLENGKIKPFTIDQIHFLNVVAKKLPPKTTFERAWLKYREAQEKQKKIITSQKVKPEEPDLINKKNIILEALKNDTLTYEQIRAITDNKWRYGFNTEEIQILELKLQEKTNSRAEWKLE